MVVSAVKETKKEERNRKKGRRTGGKKKERKEREKERETGRDRDGREGGNILLLGLVLGRHGLVTTPEYLV